MARYKVRSAMFGDEILRNGKMVGGIQYDDMLDTCKWFYVGPDGAERHCNFGDSLMTPADLKAMVMRAYGEGE